jgi:hypothetical protein
MLTPGSYFQHISKKVKLYISPASRNSYDDAGSLSNYEHSKYNTYTVQWAQWD